MRYKLFCFITVIMVTLIVNKAEIIQAILNNDYEDDDKDIMVIEELLNKRLKLINHFLYDEIDISKTTENLKKIEKGNLLDADLEMLDSMLNCPTDFPYVNKLNILKVEEYNSTVSTEGITVLIEWDISYDEETKYEKGLYKVEIEEDNNNVHLTKFEFVDDITNNAID